MAIGNPCKKGDMAIVIGGPPENIGLLVKVVDSAWAELGLGLNWHILSKELLLRGATGLWAHDMYNVPDADLQPIRGEKSCPSLTQVNSQGEKSKVSDQSSISQEESLAS